VRLPADFPDLKPLSETICQFLPLEGLAIPATLPGKRGGVIDRGGAALASRVASVPTGPWNRASGKALCFVLPEDADSDQGSRCIPFVDLASGVGRDEDTLMAWLQTGGRHASAGPLRPDTTFTRNSIPSKRAFREFQSLSGKLNQQLRGRPQAVRPSP